ncbi:MAG TPA: hypothetical protein VF220_05370 [Nitrososphaeraceae archaeon]
MTNKKQNKEVWTVRSEWSTESNGDTYEVIDVIAFNSKQIDKYIHERYNLTNSEDYSTSPEELVYSYSAIYDELGREVKHNIERCYEGEYSDQIKEGFYEQIDSISASKDYTLVNESQLEELKQNNFHTVVDLTEKSN